MLVQMLLELLGLVAAKTAELARVQEAAFVLARVEDVFAHVACCVARVVTVQAPVVKDKKWFRNNFTNIKLLQIKMT
jgi:hypothetical protein